MSAGLSVVQTHLGGDAPDHLYAQLAQTRLLNPEVPIYLILSAGASFDAEAIDRLRVVVVRKEGLALCDNHRRFLRKNHLDRRFWGGFWLYSSERFLAIESFLDACRLGDVVHMENDVMLYARLESLVPAFRSRCAGIGLTMDNEERCVPGLVYIRSAEALRRLNGFVAKEGARRRWTDMQALGAYMRRAEGRDCVALPVLPPRYRELHPLVNLRGEAGSSPWYDELFDSFGGVFDGAALGQFVGGIDKRHDPGDTRGYVSDAAVYDPRDMGFHWKSENGVKLPYGEVGGYEFPIFNLHIHSKELGEYASSGPAER